MLRRLWKNKKKMDTHIIVEKWQEECKKSLALYQENIKLKNIITKMLKEIKPNIEVIESYLNDIVLYESKLNADD